MLLLLACLYCRWRLVEIKIRFHCFSDIIIAVMIFCFPSKEISRSVTAIESFMFCPHLMMACSKGRYHLVQEVEEFWNIHQVWKALLQIKLPWNTRSTKSCNLIEIRKKARQIIGTYHQLFIFGRSFKWFVVKLEKLFLLLCVTLTSWMVSAFKKSNKFYCA